VRRRPQNSEVQAGFCGFSDCTRDFSLTTTRKNEGSKKVWHEFISGAVLRGGGAADDVITTTRLSSRLCTRSVNRLRW
jgi:hypothetical protein